MSSIRERAAALNLAEKLRVRPQTPGAAITSAHFTRLWHELVSHLRSSLTVQRHRVLLKSHSGCFLGSEVVDELVSHVTGAPEFRGTQVSREALVCVCQALLDCRVFESVPTRVLGRDKKQSVFQDSRSSLYRFVDSSPPSGDSLSRGVQVIQRLFGPPAGRSPEARCSSLQVSAEAPPQDRPVSAETSVDSVPEPLDHESVGHTGGAEPHLPPALSVEEETWQEQTLLRLLSLVELPLLEGVLQCTSAPQPGPDLVPGGGCLDRRVLRAFMESQSDPWLRAALDLLDFLPDRSVVRLSRELRSCFPSDDLSASADAAACKTLVFGLLVKHYQCAESSPLLPRHMTDVYAAITDLLVRAKADSALEALQLCLKLLPPGCREELRRLLTFMTLAADAAEVRLDKEVENRLVVKRCFSRAILLSGSLSREKEEILLMFLLSNVQDIFKVPAVLHKLVSDKLLHVVPGKQAPPTDGASDKTFTDSCREATQRELWALLRSIHHDTSRSSKERKRLLGQFSQAHPEVFNQYFGDAAAGLL